MNSNLAASSGERRALFGGHHRFSDIISEAIEIKTHREFLAWAQGTLQEYLPHDLMIASCGDFSLDIICYDIISPIPSARTDLMAEKEMASFLKRLYSYWMSKDRTPSQLLADSSVVRCRDIQDVQLKTSMQNMKTALMHAIKDVRGGSDSFYVLLSSDTNIAPTRRKFFHQILPYIDATLRQIGHLPGHAHDEPSKTLTNEFRLSSENVLRLSNRESEIMKWVCSGKTNIEIGLIVNVSSFTVKNHLQSIFKKLGVVNRGQAVAEIRGRIAPSPSVDKMVLPQPSW